MFFFIYIYSCVCTTNRGRGTERESEDEERKREASISPMHSKATFYMQIKNTLNLIHCSCTSRIHYRKLLNDFFRKRPLDGTLIVVKEMSEM